MEEIQELNESEYQGKKVRLNYPTRSSGPKKYKVFVKNPKTGKVIKVNFGDVSGGLSAKVSDPKARKSFAARHQCHLKKDKTKPGYRIAKPLKVGFSYCSLGWKTKYDSYRHEWNPVLSFVFFGYQIALTFYSPYDSHYWEPWLYYEYETDKTKSKRERIAQCIKEAPETWSSIDKDGVKETTDYYKLILKKIIGV